MTSHTLRDCRILVVEDDFLMADELATNLAEAGATVIGPFGTVEDAIATIESGPAIDSAVVDANLRGKPVFPVADLLLERGVPFAFASGYDAGVFPARFRHVAHCEKPVDLARLTFAIGRDAGG